MRYRLVSDTASSRLILIFAGWAMDSNVFGHISRPGYDVMVIWDYTSFHIDWSITDHYEEICIVAWSMGVFAVCETTQAIDYKVTRRIAVNGTPMPVSDLYGIPESVFQGTLDGLSEASLRKFYRRMCRDSRAFAHFCSHEPVREVSELKSELESVQERTFFGVGADVRWDEAIIGHDDRIFPRQNQRRAWDKLNVPHTEIEDGHYVDIAEIVDRCFVDKSLAGERFGAAVDTYESQAAVQADAIDRLLARCSSLGVCAAVTAARGRVLEIGSGSGMLTRRLARLIGSAEFDIWDLAAPCPRHLPDRLKIRFLNCDAEMQISRVPRGQYEFIFTASTVQWFNSPALFFRNCARALTDDGILALTTYTMGNMHEISDITGISLPLLTPDAWKNAASSHFEILHSQAYIRDLDFDSPLDVLRHMKVTGVNSLSRSSGGSVSASEVIRRYPMRLDGRYHLTYHPFILILRKK
ncbi:MAG: DUF452 family protein [Muribaculaceae bacterium]|nr:DUF452 family protein [Muribaculaceae bacterium]